jgi:hypothetical protein
MTVAGLVVPWKARFTALAPSIICYAAACSTPALELSGKEHTYLFGVLALFYGPLVVLIGQFAWFANPVWLIALLLVLAGRLRAGIVASLLAFVVATHAWALFGREIPGDEGGVTKYYLKSMQIGFYLWLLTFILLAAGAALAQRRATQRLRHEE